MVVVVMTLLVLNPLIKLCLKLATPKVQLCGSISFPFYLNQFELNFLSFAMERVLTNT